MGMKRVSYGYLLTVFLVLVALPLLAAGIAIAGNGSTLDAWVLAINPDKSIYLEEEDAFIGMAVLDEKGQMVCDSNLTLDITPPNGTIETFTTENGEIQVSPQCNYYGKTELPDFYLTYPTGSEGSYSLNLTTLTPYGTKSIFDQFLVAKWVPYGVRRYAPTRVYPPERYRVILEIKANQDYSGKITEYVPSDFEISEQEGIAVEQDGEYKKLVW
ncbi:MAG: hypothetical protein JW727_06670, partial [Candidatus Aenigmarchaeota archaeon]|nr:hypothetical protein [Candidatus Aenigmarchaeota archaeon]